MKLRLALLLGVVLPGSMLTAVSALKAQTRSESADGPSRAFTANPFLLLAGWISAEYEQRINSSVSLAGGFSSIDYDPNRYTTLEVKGRLYPTEHAMRGFAIASSLGVSWLRFRPDQEGCLVFPATSNPCNAAAVKKVTSPTFGIELGYQWLLGTHRRTAITVGAGAMRFLAPKSSLSGLDPIIGTWRGGIGYAF